MIDTKAIRAKLAHVKDGELPPTLEAIDALKSLVTEDVPKLLAEVVHLQTSLRSAIKVGQMQAIDNSGQTDQLDEAERQIEALYLDSINPGTRLGLLMALVAINDVKTERRHKPNGLPALRKT